MISAEYIWVDTDGITMKSKLRSLPNTTKGLRHVPTWTYD